MTETKEAIWRVDPDKCIGCGDCVIICPTKALGMENKRPYVKDPKSCCRESCRICEYHCQKFAIKAY